METRANKFRLIAGSGRSGTTWALDAIARANGLRPVFEPLHPEAWRAARDFAYRTYRDTDDAPQLARLWDSILAGGGRPTWTRYRVRPDRLAPSAANFSGSMPVKRYLDRWRKLARNYRTLRPSMRNASPLVKSIRANLMLGWIEKHYDARIVLIMRHPASVVESQLRLGGEDWDAQRMIDAYRRDARLQAVLPGGMRAALDQLSRPAQKLTWLWCVENIVATRLLPSHSRVRVISYERLLVDRTAWQELAGVLDLAAVPDDESLRLPSQQAARIDGRSVFDGSNASDWRARLATRDARDVQAVLDIAGAGFDLDSDVPTSALLPARAGDGSLAQGDIRGIL